MRSNKLISMLAMAAVMVGCSQEEIATVENAQIANGSLAERPAISGAVLGLGTESRLALAEGSSLNVSYVTGDQLGACIIDEPVEGSVAGKDKSWTYAQYVANANQGTEDDPLYYSTDKLAAKDFYSPVEYISTNYPYARDEEGKWNTQANLVEGGYMFYMPYNAAHLNRTRIQAVLPQVQDCSDDVMRNATYGTEKVSSSSTVLDKFYKGTVADAENAPVVVAYQFLEAPKDGSIIYPSVQMTHLFAYPMITIKNDFNGYMFIDKVDIDKYGSKYKKDMTIDSIQIYYAGDKSPLFHKASISSEKLIAEYNDETAWDDKKLTEGAPTSDILADDATTMKQANGYAPKNTVASNQLDMVKNQNRVTCVIDKVLKTNESYSFRTILPAANYEHNLKARVYVTIDGKQYILAVSDAKDNKINIGSSTAPAYRYYPTKVEDFTFVDDVNGAQACELVRGQQYPKAEIREDGSALKAFAGSMMTISLAGADAFQLEEAAPQAADNGIMTNEELINYLIDYVQRGEVVTEYADLRNKARSEWKTYNTAPVIKAAGNLAFAENNTIIINAQLIKDLKLQTQVTEADACKFVLTSAVLPIANDVKITDVTGTVYTFATLDETVSYKIDMKATFNTDAEKLVAGINTINGAGETLTAKASTVSNAVVYLTGGSVTYASTTKGVNAIYVNTGSTLYVNAACDALIIANGGTINVGSNGSLSNANNLLKNVTINNNNFNAIAGTVSGTTTVTATVTGWPNAAVPANSKITNLNINPLVANVLVTEQAQINTLTNLSKIVITLNTNVTSIKSNADVTLTNIKSITATPVAPATDINWITENVSGITVSKVKYDGTNLTTLSKITSDGVSVKIQ